MVGRIVDQDIQTAKVREAAPNESDTMGFFANIASNDNAATSLLPHKLLGILGVIILAQIGNEQICALPGESNCDAAANAAVRPGYERNLSFELVAPTIRLPP